MLRQLTQRRLERGSSSLPARALGRVWERFSSVLRPLLIPPGVKVIGVGGATLGGSGKTPAVIAIARELSATRSVSVVASGYRAKVRATRRVRVDDSVVLVGDEALLLARELAPSGVSVFVAPSRDQALRLASEQAAVVIIDGLLQSRPEPVALSLLVLDGRSPWGSGRCPPAGDLRAPRTELTRVCDAVILLGEGSVTELQGPIWRAQSQLVSVRTDDGDLPIGALSAARVGVALAIARPERVLRGLDAIGVRPAEVVLAADHGWFDAARLGRILRQRRLDAWLTTGKCGVKLEGSGVPVWVLEHRVQIEKGAVPGALEAW